MKKKEPKEKKCIQRIREYLFSEQIDDRSGVMDDEIVYLCDCVLNKKKKTEREEKYFDKENEDQ
jgi:hypothetical protein